MNTQAARSYRPPHSNPGNREILWKETAGSADSQVVCGLLVIRISGRCDYKRMVELAFYVAGRWGLGQREVVLDFSHVVSADSEGLRFLVSQLHETSVRGDGNISLVRAPSKARAFLKQTWGGSKVHFAITLKHAIAKSKQPGSKVTPVGPVGLAWTP